MTGDRAERMVDTFFHANSHIYSEDVVNMIRREQAWLRRTVLLLERLNQSQSRIGTMCSERRGPRRCTNAGRSTVASDGDVLKGGGDE